jgi:hypothetical protein
MPQHEADTQQQFLNNGKILFAGVLALVVIFTISGTLQRTNQHFFTHRFYDNCQGITHCNAFKNGTVLITGGHKDRRVNITIYSSAELYEPDSEN